MIDRTTRVVVRRFDAARDLESLRECVIDQQNFHRTIEPSRPAGDAIVGDYLTHLAAECAAHNGCIIMVHCGEQAAGFVCVVASARGESPDDPATFAWIHDIYVKPEHRQRGAASMLMAAAERFARDEGAQSVRLGVLYGNERARRFYASHGFREYTHVLTKPLQCGPPAIRISLLSVDGDRAAFVPLLLEADESESVLRVYLNDGDLMELVANGQPVGVVLLISPEPGAVEIKNIAIRREYRGQGIGRAAIGYLAARAKGHGADRLVVGTADSSERTIAFYRACGFQDAGRIAGFFDAYPEPVVQDGVQAHDMVRFQIVLTSR